METFSDVPLLPSSEVLALLRSGDLLLCQGTSAFSRMISLATNSPWTHVAILMYLAPVERWMVLQAVESVGVNALPISQYLDDYNHTGKPYPGRLFIARDERLMLKSPNDMITFSQRAIDLLDTKYDNKALGDIALRLMGAKLGLPPYPPERDDVFLCSEYADELGRSIGIEVPYSETGYIFPSDFARCAFIHILCEIAIRRPS
jgi:hypothetical protein